MFAALAAANAASTSPFFQAMPPSVGPASDFTGDATATETGENASAFRPCETDGSGDFQDATKTSAKPMEKDFRVMAGGPNAARER